MRTLKYAILGLLNQRSMTGYELMLEFESALNEFWSAKHSQIYPELKRLADEGLVDYVIEISGKVLEKKLYSITDTGKADFLEWVAMSEEPKATPKDVFRLRVFFSAVLDVDLRVQQLEDQLYQHKSRMAHLKNNQKKFDGIPEKNSQDFGDYLVLMGAIMREENHCKWLKKCIDLNMN